MLQPTRSNLDMRYSKSAVLLFTYIYIYKYTYIIYIYDICVYICICLSHTYIHTCIYIYMCVYIYICAFPTIGAGGCPILASFYRGSYEFRSLLGSPDFWQPSHVETQRVGVPKRGGPKGSLKFTTHRVQVPKDFRFLAPKAMKGMGFREFQTFNVGSVKCPRKILQSYSEVCKITLNSVHKVVPPAHPNFSWP